MRTLRVNFCGGIPDPSIQLRDLLSIRLTNRLTLFGRLIQFELEPGRA